MITKCIVSFVLTCDMYPIRGWRMWLWMSRWFMNVHTFLSGHFLIICSCSIWIMWFMLEVLLDNVGEFGGFLGVVFVV